MSNRVGKSSMKLWVQVIPRSTHDPKGHGWHPRDSFLLLGPCLKLLPDNSQSLMPKHISGICFVDYNFDNSQNCVNENIYFYNQQKLHLRYP